MKFCCCLLFILVNRSHGFLDLDLSNVDLANFKYIRYSPTPIYYIRSKGIWVRPIPKPENKFIRAYKRTRAAFDYLKQVLIGNPLDNRRMNFVFDQQQAERDSVEYQKHFGPYGEHLIQWLGSGNHLKELKYYGLFRKAHWSKHYNK